MKPILLILCLLSCLIGFSQMHAGIHPFMFSPVSATNRYNNIKPDQHNGYAITLKGDTLAGQIRFKMHDRNDPFDVYVNDKKFSSKNIVSIRLNSVDTTYSNLSFTEFTRVKAHSQKFYRKIMDGKIAVYDDWLLTNEKPGTVSFDEMLLVKDGKIVPMFDFWITSDKRQLIRLVNELLSTHFEYKDFHSKYAVLKWLKNNTGSGKEQFGAGRG